MDLCYHYDKVIKAEVAIKTQGGIRSTNAQFIPSVHRSTNVEFIPSVHLA
jgi:hypothetical protein